MLLYFCLFFIWTRITVQPFHFIFEIAHCEQILKKFLKLLKFLLHQTKVVKILCLFISYSNKSIVVKKKSFIVLCVHLKKYQQIVKYLCLFFNTNDFYLPTNSLFFFLILSFYMLKILAIESYKINFIFIGFSIQFCNLPLNNISRVFRCVIFMFYDICVWNVFYKKNVTMFYLYNTYIFLWYLSSMLPIFYA